MTLDEVETTFRRWLHLPDAGALHAALAAIVANRTEGDPIWLLLVGPPSGGKSEILTALYGLPDVHPAATLTEAALLSGTPKREHADDSRGGLLRQIGDFGIIVAKDFTSVLGMNKDSRAQLLSALREVYDGAWTRHVGTDGGRTLHWQGKVGFLGGVTPAIDRQHAVMGAMGERFVFYRLPETDESVQARQALKQAGNEDRMRRELAHAVERMLENVDSDPEPGSFTDDDAERLILLATLVVRGRSAVERDNHTREIEQIYPPEAPSRIIKVLRRLLHGLDAIGLDHDQAWQLVAKLGLDSMPELRRNCLMLLYSRGPMQTPHVGEALGYPTVTVRRTLEDLTGHALVLRTIKGEGQRADTWAVSEFARSRIESCVPVFLPPTQSERHRSDGLGVNGAIPYSHPGTSGTQTALPTKREHNGNEDESAQTLTPSEPNFDDSDIPF